MLGSLALTITAVGGVLSALIGGVVLLRKVGPEKDSIFISSAQGAAVIMDNLVDTLREEIDRCHAKMEALTAENERLMAANKALAQQSGRRHFDQEE